jgi:nucleoside-diphosphate-sugar epimerase
MAQQEKFLVTGALGCIGAWAVKLLADEGTSITTYDLPGNPHRLRLIMDDAAMSRVNFVHGDITDYEHFERTVVEHGITHIVHLAALQVPLVKANPIQGAKVNVVGTAIVLETARHHKSQVQSLAFASSVAVYDDPASYGDAPLAHDAPHGPLNLYGAYKHCNEDQARIYWQDYGVRSIGIRPCVVYGPGRDQGMTSTPSKAMVAAAIGQRYHISYGGTSIFQYARDTARVFIQAARASYTEAHTYNLGGSTVHMSEVVAAIDLAAPEQKGNVTFEPVTLAIPQSVDDAPLERAIGQIKWTPLNDGVRESIETFKTGMRLNRLDAGRVLS